MKNKTIKSLEVLSTVRKPTLPASRPFKDKRSTKEAKKAWKKEVWN